MTPRPRTFTSTAKAGLIAVAAWGDSAMRNARLATLGGPVCRAPTGRTGGGRRSNSAWLERRPFQSGRAASCSKPREARATAERRSPTGIARRRRAKLALPPLSRPAPNGDATMPSSLQLSPSNRAEQRRSPNSRGGIPPCETLASLRSADRCAAPPPGRLAEVGAPIPLGWRGATEGWQVLLVGVFRPASLLDKAVGNAICGSLLAVSETQRALLYTGEPQNHLQITFRHK